MGGGGALFHPTVSPHDPDTVVAGCDMTGSYLSHDAGRSWRSFHLRGTASCFAFDPRDRDTLYVAAVGLWRSRDAGQRWELLYPDPASIDRLDRDGDEASLVYVVEGQNAGTVTSVVVDQADVRRLILSVTDDAGTTLVESLDRGQSWNTVTRLVGERVHSMYLHPAGHRLYVFTDQNLWVGAVDGLQRRSSLAPSGAFVRDAAGFDTQSGAAVLYHVTDHAITVSRNDGESWQESFLPGSSYTLSAVAAAPSRPEVAFVAYGDLLLDGAQEFGWAKTVDGGRTWVLNDAPPDSPQPFVVDDDWTSQPYGSPYLGALISFGSSPNDPDLWYATSLGCTWKTGNGGETWEQVYFQREGNAGVRTTGLDVTTNYGVFVDPHDPDRRFIAYTDIGLCRSEDAGKSWRNSIDGVPPDWYNTTYWIAFDPDVPGRVWGVMSYHHDLPRAKMFPASGTLPAYRGGVCVSDDGARTWRVSNAGIPDTAPTHIVLDPRSPVGARTLYATAFGKGVYRSTDDGASWALANRGIAESEPLAWRLQMDRDGALYLVVCQRSEDISGALYRSRDGAASWERMRLPDNVKGPTGICVDGIDPARLYLAGWRGPERPADTGGGVFVSTDAGASWEKVLDRDQHIYDVTQDPNDPSILFAGGFESNLWRSLDRGQTWGRVPGFNFKAGHRAVVDPLDPAMIYVTTFGGGVWYGPAQGDPAAWEDIETPQLAYDRVH